MLEERTLRVRSVLTIIATVVLIADVGLAAAWLVTYRFTHGHENNTNEPQKPSPASQAPAPRATEETRGGHAKSSLANIDRQLGIMATAHRHD